MDTDMNQKQTPDLELLQPNEKDTGGFCLCPEGPVLPFLAYSYSSFPV